MKSQEERIKEWRGAGFKNGVAVTFWDRIQTGTCGKTDRNLGVHTYTHI
jgi:hypothetical protein